MKKIILSAFIITGLVVGCSPKISPSVKSGEFPMASEVKTSGTMVTAGEAIFNNQCTKCHGAKTKYVANHTFDEARGVMTNMSKKANLTAEQIDQLAAYVNSVAKK